MLVRVGDGLYGVMLWIVVLGSGRTPRSDMSAVGGVVSARVLCEAVLLLSPRAVMEEGMSR